jgi:hypothetical protein
MAQTGADWKISAFKMSSSGMKAMLNEDWLRDELTDRGQRGLAAAQAGNPNRTYAGEVVYSDRVKYRYGSDDEGTLYSEAVTGNLVRSLDACAGSS